MSYNLQNQYAYLLNKNMRIMMSEVELKFVFLILRINHKRYIG